MPDSLDQEIRQQLARYLAGELALADFEGWLASVSWDEPSELAGEVTLRIAEFTSGDWTEDELRARLQPLAPAWTTVERVVMTGSTDEGDATAHRFSVAGTRFQVAGG
jgi:hypothetical protein